VSVVKLAQLANTALLSSAAANMFLTLGLAGTFVCAQKRLAQSSEEDHISQF
jgi:hypothetical protein